MLSRGLQVVLTSGTTHYLLTSAKICFLPLLYCAMVWLLCLFFSSKTLFYKMFAKNCFCASRGISLSTGRDAGRGKTAYI